MEKREKIFSLPICANIIYLLNCLELRTGQYCVSEDQLSRNIEKLLEGKISNPIYNIYGKEGKSVISNGTTV